MPELMDIKDFISRIAQGITFAIDIDTQVIDKNLRRVAGTVYKPIPQNGGVVKNVIDVGEYTINILPRGSDACCKCNYRDTCKELGYIHCPIEYNGEIVGVMGLICYEKWQLEKIQDDKRQLLNFMQSMCELIRLKLKEEEVREKEQELYKSLNSQNKVLNQILNHISDGYIILNMNNEIQNINKKAMRILKADPREVVGKEIWEFIQDSMFADMIANERVNTYEKIKIGDKSYGMILYKIIDKENDIAKILNFKTIDNIGTRVAEEAYMDQQISFDHILGESERMRKLKEIASKAAKTMPNILLIGETGTGKEMFARAIHNASDRAARPFVPVNCASIPLELFESELFGYEEGAFTGAKKGGKIGKFELANTGTIFLDEIGDMPFHLQAKLLRVLQERKLERVGGTKQIPLDIRIISATNRDLVQMIREGKFREDLYYRLNIFGINLPPLRERREDIPLLVNYFIEKYRSFFDVNVLGVDYEAMECLCNYSWQGNIRELENVIQYMISMSADAADGIMSIKALPPQFTQENRVTMAESTENRNGGSRVGSRGGGIRLDDLEQQRIRETLKKYGTSTKGKKMAAEELGISLATLYRRLKNQ